MLSIERSSLLRSATISLISIGGAIGLAFNCFAQTLVFKGDSTVKCKKIEVDGDWVEVKLKSGRERFKAEEIAGYYEDAGPYFYMTFFPDGTVEDVETGSLNKEKKYAFVEHVTLGEIKLYMYLIKAKTLGYTSAGPHPGGMMLRKVDVGIYYVQKGDGKLQGPGLSWLPYLLDSSEQRSQLRKANSRQDYEELIGEYNTARFKPTTIMTDQTSPMYFYVNSVNKVGRLQLTVNDSIEYTVPFDRSLEVQLPSFVELKVCVKSEESKLCRIVKAFPYFSEYYQLRYDKNHNKLEWIKSDKSNEAYFMGKFAPNK